RRLRRVRLSDDVEDDVGVAGGVDPGDSQRRARRCRCRRGEDRKGGSRRGGRKCGGPPHWNAPSKLVGEKADRVASASSFTPNKLCGSTTPFCASFSRKCGFSPVHWSGVSSRARPPVGLCSSSGGRAAKMSC